MGDGGVELKTNRIEALSDGIFAIAMTILILSFETVIHRPQHVDEKAVFDMIIGLWPDFLHYAISFIILGAFWFQHHLQFHHVNKVDMTLLYINIAALMFVGLIPFTTVIVSDYGHTRVAAMVFEANMLIAGLIFFAHWVYASRNNRLLAPDSDARLVSYYRKRNLVIPVASIVAIMVSGVMPRWGTAVYFLVPVVLMMWKKKK